MKCPYRKRIIHDPKETKFTGIISAIDREEFEECYGKECPFYDNGQCKKVYVEVQRGR